MRKFNLKGIFGMALALCLCAGLASDPMSVAAHAEEYTYQATIYAGNHGRLTSGVEVTVNNKKSGSSYYIDRSQDKIVIRGLMKGDRVSVDVMSEGAVQMDPGSPYYVKGLRDSGLDNSEAGYGSFRVQRDQDFVVAYGMKTEETSYTVYYRSLDGADLAPARTYYGNVGDKPVAAYLYVDGYTPLSYNITKTLSDDPADNAMTFLYKESEGATVTVTVPGETNYIHMPGGSYTVNVPGPTIVQTVPSSGNNNGQNGNGYGDGTNSNPGGNGDANANNGGNSGQGTGDNSQNAGNNGDGQNAGDNGQNSGGSGDGQNAGDNGQNANGGDGQGNGDNGQNAGDNGSGQSGGTPTEGNGATPGQGTDLNGTGAHGNRNDGTPGGTGPDDNSGSDGSGSSIYKPGGSLDVVISNDYQPSEILDLDENPSGVPLGEAPDGAGANAGDQPVNNSQGDTGDTGDAAQDSMNENTGNTGTGQDSPEGNSGGLPIVPIAIGAVAVLAAIAGVVFFLYKKQQSGGDGEEEDG